MEASSYLPTVAWRTIVRDVIPIDGGAGIAPTLYRLSVKPIDINEPGAMAAEKAVGYFLKDYAGHTYTIVAVNGGTIDVSDDFKMGQGPQSGQQGIVYKSVFGGRSPYLAPIYYRHLDRSARDFSYRFELELLWRNDPNAIKIPFSNTDSPALVNYQDSYADDYGELPKIQLWQIDNLGNIRERTEKPYFQLVDGLIDSVVFGILPEVMDGFIVISK